VLPASLIAALNRAWDHEIRPFEGPLLRQLTSRPEHHAFAGGRIVNPILASALPVSDFPASAAAFDALLGLPALWDLARAWLEDPGLLQIAWVESTEGSAWHQDFHPILEGGRILGLWVALEDIAPEAGPFRVISGSHLDDFAADWRALARAAARAQWVDGTDPRGEAGAWLAHEVDRALLAAGRHAEELLPAAGDVIVWDGRLIHGSRPPRAHTGRTRRSVLLHLVPREPR
jgi:hypothetical protein